MYGELVATSRAKSCGGVPAVALTMYAAYAVPYVLTRTLPAARPARWVLGSWRRRDAAVALAAPRTASTAATFILRWPRFVVSSTSRSHLWLILAPRLSMWSKEKEENRDERPVKESLVRISLPFRVPRICPPSPVSEIKKEVREARKTVFGARPSPHGP